MNRSPIKRLVHVVKVRPRLFIVAALGVIIGFVLPESAASQSITRWLVAWNAAAWLYIVLAAVMMVRSSKGHMRHRAQLQDDGKYTILGMVVVSAIASLVAIGCELSVVKDMHGWLKEAHIALAGLTVIASTTGGYLFSVAVWSFGEIFPATVTGAIVARLAPEDLRGRYSGLYSLAVASGWLTSSLGGTQLLSVSPLALWGSCALLSAASAYGVLRLAPRLRPVKPERSELL